MRSMQSGLLRSGRVGSCGAAFGQLNSAVKSTYQPSYSIFVLLGPLHESAELSISCMMIRCRACIPNIVFRSPVSLTMYVIVMVPPRRVTVVVDGAADGRVAGVSAAVWNGSTI